MVPMYIQGWCSYILACKDIVNTPFPAVFTCFYPFYAIPTFLLLLQNFYHFHLCKCHGSCVYHVCLVGTMERDPCDNINTISIIYLGRAGILGS